MYNWKVVLITIIALLSVRVADPKLIEQLRLNVFDSLQTLQQVNESDIILVDIDERALEEYGQFPFSRDIYAKVLDKNGNDSVYVFNMGFTSPDRFGKDSILNDSLQHKDVLLSSFPTNAIEKGSAPYLGFGTFGGGTPSDWLYYYKGLSEPVDALSHIRGVGTVSAAPSVDGIIREAPLVVMANGHVYPSLALEVLRVYDRADNYTMKVSDQSGIEWIRMGKGQPIVTTANSNLTIAYWNRFERISFGDPMPDGNIYVIGLSAGGLVNPVPTPLGAMYPHDVQANILETVIHGIQIQRPWWSDNAEFAILILLSLMIIAIVYNTPIKISAPLVIITISMVLYSGYHLFMSKLYLIDVVYPSIVAFIVFAHSTFNNYIIVYNQKQLIKKQFGTYLDPRQVELLQKDPSLLKLGGERKDMSYLFMDIVGFTPISEHFKNNNDPEGLVLLVNEFLNEMTNIILANGGTIDKYMGDCIMAFWNAPLPCIQHADMAVKSAIEIEARSKVLSERFCERGLPRLNVGTGVNTGTCIVGNMGSETRFDYSVIGDAVNLAARLEATAARHEYIDYKTIISSYTRDQLSDEYQCKDIGTIKVKGKEDLISIYYPYNKT